MDTLCEQRDHVGCDYYGTTSHFFRIKTGLTWDTAFHHCQVHEGMDVYGCKARFQDKQTNVWLQGDMWHKDFSKFGKKIGDNLGIDFLSLKTAPIYYNYWWTRPELFEDFVITFLRPSMAFIDTLSEANEDSGYRVNKDRDVDTEHLMKIYGRPYYTYHPFLCERLFPTYVAHKRLTYKLI